MIPLHGIASRDDLPLPFELVVAGAAATLVLTFVILFWAWRRPRYEEPRGTELPRLGRIVDAPWFLWPVRAVVALVWLLAGSALVFGPDVMANPIFGFVFVLLWVGLVPASLLLGRFHRATNPIRLLTGFSPTREEGSHLPAVLAVLAFLYFELVEPRALLLGTMQILAIVWLAWLVIGRAGAGREWVARADPFEAMATVVARMSPWARSEHGVLMWTSPLRNLASPPPRRHLAPLVCVLLAGTLFDAVSASAWWVRLTQGLAVPTQLIGASGLLLTCLLVTGMFHLCVAPLRGSDSVWRAADRFAPSLIPLVVGYSLSHYFTYLYLEGQRTLIRLNDPMSLNWNLFGGAEWGPDTTWFMFPMLIAVVQVGLIVAGHVIGALVAHDIALRTTPRPSAQLPLLLAMVVLTVGGMLLMFGG